MGKSSSRKRKRSDASRLSHKKKSKSKRTRNKSKKLRHHHRSDSFSSDSDLPGSTYSSSQDDYRRQRRSRSLSRGNARVSKKRNRQRSYSSESSEDSHPATKRRGSKRNDDRKKTHRKKHKRRVTASSTSSGSLSCSTCDSRSKCCKESEFESRRSRSRQRDGHNRGAGKDKIVAERSRYKARSHSSCSKCSMDSHDQNEEILVNADSSKRLRSVIMVSNEAEERKLDRDEHKEEILYNNDDYPSSRSTDNNGSGSKRELARQSYVESKLKGHCEDSEDAAPNKRSTSVVEKSGGCNDQFDGSNPSSDVVPSFTAVNGNNATVSDGAVDDDLESVLRQKALENLKKFRGINKGNQDSGQHGNIDDVKQTPTVTPESTKFPKEASTVSAHTAQKKGTTITQRRISIHKTSFDGNVGDQEHEAVKPSSSRGSIQLPDCGLLGGNLRRLGGFTANNPRLTPFTWRRDMTKTEPAARELPRLLKEPPQAKLLETEVAANKNVASMAKTGTRERSSRDGGVEKESGSAVSEPSSSLYPKSVSGEKNPTDKVEDEAKDGPQYEQRTMSVTRGGETIQVNYQVYIPKRAPALSRRQLKR